MFDVRAIFIVTLVLFAIATISKAENSEKPKNFAKISEHESSSTTTDIGTSRIKQSYYYRSAFLGLGGLNALAVLYAIKVKVIVVAIIIAVSIYYYAKVYLKSCLHKEKDFSFSSSYDPSGYSNSLPAGIGYPGRDRFNSPPTASFDHDDHLLDRSSIPSSNTLSSTNKSQMVNRIYNQMRQFSNPIFDNIDWTDMVFELLGLNSDECRRRFTCELDFRLKQIPFSSYMLNSDSPAFLNKYREQSNDVNQATTFSDCALFYGECKYSLLG